MVEETELNLEAEVNLEPCPTSLIEFIPNIVKS